MVNVANAEDLAYCTIVSHTAWPEIQPVVMKWLKKIKHTVRLLGRIQYMYINPSVNYSIHISPHLLTIVYSAIHMFDGSEIEKEDDFKYLGSFKSS